MMFPGVSRVPLLLTSRLNRNPSTLPLVSPVTRLPACELHETNWPLPSTRAGYGGSRPAPVSSWPLLFTLTRTTPLALPEVRSHANTSTSPVVALEAALQDIVGSSRMSRNTSHRPFALSCKSAAAQVPDSNDGTAVSLVLPLVS